jgi:hypothetical protein
MALTKTTQEFRVKWDGPREVDEKDILAMISDLFSLIEQLEKKL